MREIDTNSGNIRNNVPRVTSTNLLFFRNSVAIRGAIVCIATFLASHADGNRIFSGAGGDTTPLKTRAWENSTFYAIRQITSLFQAPR